MDPREPDRLLWPECLKVAALFAVILIHSAAPLLIAYETLGLGTWLIGNLYDASARWCIPVFIMLSGAFIIDKAEGKKIRQFLERRMRRVLIPFVAWSAIYFVWRTHANHEKLAALDFFPLILSEPVYYHLWFLYVLIGLYLLAPILRAYLQRARRRNLAYFAALWIVFGSLLPMIESMFSFSLYHAFGNTVPLAAYVGYFVLGRVLRDVVPTTRQRILLLCGWTAAAALTAIGTYALTIVRNNGTFDGLFYEYYSVNVAGMALSLFLAVKGPGSIVHMTHTQHRSHAVVMSLAACVPGMYLIHAMIIAVLARGMTGLRFSQTSLPPMLGVPAFAMVVFGISFAATFVIRKLPLVRWIVP